MKKLILLSSGLLSTAVFAAMPVNQPTGSSFTLSNAPNQRALSTVFANPAAPFIMVNQADDDSFRFGILGPLSIGVEMGDVSDLGDQVEEVEDLIDNATALTASGDVAKANKILDDIGDNAYIKTTASMQIPFMPVIYKTKTNGAFMIDASISGVAKASLLAGDVQTTGAGSNTTLTTDTSYYAQTATDLQIGFGYSQAMWEHEKGMLIGGVKANLHDISMGRALVRLDDDSQDAGDAISDSISDDAVSSTNVGLDLGVVWVANNYQVGLTVANINEPEFDGADITTNSASDRYDVTASDKYVMEMQSTVDFAISTKGKQFTVGMSYDANAVKDAVGDEYQWAATSLSYYGDSHFIPGLRVGMRQNMAGTELSYGTFGLTILKRLNIDLAVALDTVKDEDGDEMPRSAYFSIGYDTAF
ncbi:conjugal transfer protein TraF [Marinomonas sp. A79]|uniref:Conjugal transfer protein TraF n=1 Tax=Marinomonas vulgaris TaxID=2823372 RepID=A0ABS5HDH9_9GAMM|nr:conjugal transfer protein TraF [Marinomonas vulgaris]MBR7889474.1 conjugal transfer protein TraF [Marinomonas vulgaris]